MVFTAVLAAIAVIAAMITVPGAEAQDGDGRFSVESNKGLPQIAKEDSPNWGTMVWTGEPDGSDGKMNVGWAWCIDPVLKQPINTGKTYDRNNAGKAPIEPEYRDAAINVATKMHNAMLRGEKQTVANYSVYLAALIGSSVDNGKYVGGARNDTREHILNPTHSSQGDASALWDNYKGSAEEFTQLTGFVIKRDPNRPDKGAFILEKDPSVSIPKAPEEAYITIVGPEGTLTSDHGSLKGNQRVFTPDQPGLPDNPDHGGGSEQPTTSDENTTEETTSENPEGETSSSETTSDSEPSDSEETTTEDTDEPTPGKTTDVVPNPEPTPTSSEQEKKLEPKISTNADFEDGSHEVVAGAKIVDEVSYEGLVPGKEYTLKAELISKADGKTVLGKGEATFKPEKSEGKEPVTITVNDDVTEPVEAAVAFEELTSTEVDENGKDTPDASSDNPNEIAEHKDIKDEDQTVTSKKTDEPSSSEPVVPEKPSESDKPSDEPSESETSTPEPDGEKPEKGTTSRWIYLIPGIGLGQIIKDHFDHKDHGNHDGGNGKHTDGHDSGNGHEAKDQDAPKGGNSDNGHGRGVEVQGQEPEETGNALSSNAERVEIKSVPSGATELEPGMQDYIK